ncbi:Retrovirus-related Pol polyprotein from transposon opus [Vitis vinifera]|uniref:Retrovirus-related Pol polyprotein from transposon opus n=1 Tax=Vitis vinifera TaxID=29760 RepID=A0A438DCE4_VITVI|nr:Retrovirus-related Pol polyprotein from transposon opus [Vitis vinifera]
MDVSLESKSLPSVGNSRKSYLQVTSQRLARGKLVHLLGRRSLALPSVGPGEFWDLDNKNLMKNISSVGRKYREALGTISQVQTRSARFRRCTKRAAKSLRSKRLISQRCEVVFQLVVFGFHRDGKLQGEIHSTVQKGCEIISQQKGDFAALCKILLSAWSDRLAMATSGSAPKVADMTVIKNASWQISLCFSSLHSGFAYGKGLQSFDVLQRCIEKDLVLNWEKCHFMVQQGIVLGHIISKNGIEVDKAKVELIVKLPPPTNVKGIRQFLGHAGFYRRFIKDFSKISKPLCELLVKDAKFVWDQKCQKSFEELKQFLTTAPIVRAPNWKLPFEVMCDASDLAMGAVLGQREDGKPYVIYYASKTLNEAQRNYTTTEKELLAVVFALDKFRAYLVGSSIVVFMTIPL